MLTIHNYKTLEFNNIGVQQWYVGSIHETDFEYHLTLRTNDSPYQRIVKLSRESNKNHNGKMVYQYYDENGMRTLSAVTIDFIKTPSNFLRSLKSFCL